MEFVHPELRQMSFTGALRFLEHLPITHTHRVAIYLRGGLESPHKLMMITIYVLNFCHLQLIQRQFLVVSSHAT